MSWIRFVHVTHYKKKIGEHPIERLCGQYIPAIRVFQEILASDTGPQVIPESNFW